MIFLHPSLPLSTRQSLFVSLIPSVVTSGVVHRAVLGVQHVEGRPGDDAPPVRLLLDALRHEARADEHGVRDRSYWTTWPTAGSDHVCPTLFSIALAVSATSPYGAIAGLKLV